MEEIRLKKSIVNGAVFYLESAVYVDKKLVYLSGVARSEQVCKSVVASLKNNSVLVYKDTERATALCSHSYNNESSPYFGFYTKHNVGKESFTHFIALRGNYRFKSIGEHQKDSCSYLTTIEDEPETLYNLLMEHYKYPLLREWMPAFIKYWESERYISFGKDTSVFLGNENYVPMVTIMNKKVPVTSLIARDFFFSEALIENTISTLFERGDICISQKPQNKIDVENLDEYIQKYGTSIIDNLDNVIIPRMENVPNIETVALKDMRLYPQQICKVNGAINAFKGGKKMRPLSSLFVIMGCGTGKTIQTTSMAEGYANALYMNKTVSNLLNAIKSTSYRNVVMCPGHLVEKWAHEISCQIPYAKVTVLTEFKQLIELQKHGRQRDGKEWFILSKDFGKLGTQLIPVPSKIRTKDLKSRVCTSCKKSSTKSICDCGCREFKIVRVDRRSTGLICPNCKEILMPYKSNIKYEVDNSGQEDFPLMPQDFASPSTSNSRCPLCMEDLWQPNPHRINVGGDMGEIARKHGKSPWVRVKIYANKAHKSTKTVWMLESYLSEYLESIGEAALNIDKDVSSSRKFPPATFIKKKLKGFFDFFIADEAHQYKSQGSAQANAFSAIHSASKRTMMLSGTIIGGYATDLFGLLYRTYPGMMKAAGFEWNDAMKFAAKYGVIAREYEVVDNSNTRYNISSRGRQLGTPKVKPGVSPLVFVDFLLDKSLFLDLSDMSAFMPPLTEHAVVVPLEDELKAPYRDTIDVLKKAFQNGEGMAVLSKMLQFSLSYTDKPYGVEPIKSTITGATLVELPDLSYLVSGDKLLNKEKKLVELVNEELANNRRCLVFCEFTGSKETIITPRIKSILEKHCNLEGKVLLLEASSPKARDREAYIRKTVEETDAKVILCNPRLIETGLDVVWYTKSHRYISFSTIIYYQMGYSLFTLFQSSRRHYRLIQKDPCKTYYMASMDTLQTAVIQLMAEKEMAMTTLQGSSSFSSESLTSMAAGTDSKQRLMEALAKNDMHNQNELQQMFDIANAEVETDNQDIDLSGFVKMPLFREIGGDETEDNAGESTNNNIEDILLFNDESAPMELEDVLGESNSNDSVFTDSNKEEFDNYDIFMAMVGMVKTDSPDVPVTNVVLKKFKKKSPDQVYVWDLF